RLSFLCQEAKNFIRYYHKFPCVIPGLQAGCPRVTHPSAAHSTSRHPEGICLASCARLACIRHADSVRPEPRSNSPKKFVCLFLTPQKHLSLKFRLTRLKKHCFLNILF